MKPLSEAEDNRPGGVNDNTPESLFKNETMDCILFVAGNEYNSRIARENLEKIRESFLAGKLAVDIVDVFQSPERALTHGVFLTPALVRTSPLCRAMLLGNLSDEAEVCRFLGQAAL